MNKKDKQEVLDDVLVEPILVIVEMLFNLNHTLFIVVKKYLIYIKE